MRPRSVAVLVLALAGVISGAEPAGPAAPASARWPLFRGPDGSGIAESDGPGPPEIGLEKNLLWKTPLPEGHSSPIVWDGRIFLTGYEPDGRRLETLCLDRHTGRILWRRSAPSVAIERVHERNTPAAPTPVTDGESVIAYFGSYGLLAYDFDGKVRWTKPLPPARTFRDFGTGTSPLLVGGRVFLDVPLEERSYLLAVQARDGSTLWERSKPTTLGGWATPVAWNEDGQTVVGVLKAGRFTAHDPGDGAERFWLEGLPTNTSATPVVSGGLLFLTGTGGQGEADNLRPPPPFDEMIARYDRSGDGRIGTDELPDSLLHTDRQATDGAGNRTLKDALSRVFEGTSASYGRAEWEEKVRGLVEFARSRRMESAALAVRLGGRADVTRSHVLWREPRGVPEIPSPLVYRDRLYLMKSGGIVISREAATGKAVFEGRLGAPGGYYASPVAGQGRIYVASDAGVITVFSAEDTLRVLARADLEEPILATPAIAGGNLYVRTTRHLLAFGAPAAAKRP